jgi:hypothetical protein
LAAIDLVAAALLMMSWLTGDHFLPWVSWHSEALVFLAVLLIAWNGMWRVWRAGKRVIALPITTLPFLLLLLTVVVQRIVGLEPFNGDVWVLFFYTALCVILLALGYGAASPECRQSAANAGDEFELLAWTVLGGALLSTAVAFSQVFDVWNGVTWIVRMPELRRPGANLAQPNHLATLQVMGVASLLYLRSFKTIGRLAFGAIMLMLCIGIASTESRTGALSLGLLFGWWAWKRSGYPVNAREPGPAVWGLAFAAIFLGWPYLLNTMHLLPSSAAPRVAQGSIRFAVWPQLFEAVAMKPWQGWGFHQVAAAQNAALSHAVGVSQAFTYSHNLFLDLVLWLGVPIGVSLAAAGVVYLARHARAAEGLLPCYALAVVLPLAVHSMLEYPYAYAYLLAPPLFLVGALERTTKTRPLVLGAVPVGLILTFVTVAMGWSAVEYLRMEEDFRVARFQSLHIGAVPNDYHMPRAEMFDQLGVLVDDARTTPVPNMSPDAMRIVKSAALCYPWLATQYRYAMALALNGNPTEASRQLNVIRAMWEEKDYAAIKQRIADLSTQYPELRHLVLP